MSKRLLVLAGPDEGRTLPIPAAETLLLGRSRATESRLIDPHVSRVHCQVQMEGERVTVTDFDSAGGTFVNGKKIAGKQSLNPGDLIRIGNTRLQYLDDAPEAFAPDPSTVPPLAIPAKVAAAGKAGWPNALVGQKISNYKIGPIMARAKCGYVFHARDTRKNLPVALKVLEPNFSQDDKAVERFVRAMKTALPLRHPNLVTVYAAGKTGPNCWIAMEYVPGESLAAVIGRVSAGGMLDWRQVLRFAIFIDRALCYAHEQKIMHRNITPQNIIIGHNAKDTKLSDLMLAKAIEGENVKEITRTGELLGDVPYVSPESTFGRAQEVDGRSDIYSLGATVYAMLTGQPPFKGETITELVTQIRRELPIPLKSLHLGTPEKLELIIEKMMAKKPADRYANAKELLQDLELLAHEKNVSV